MTLEAGRPLVETLLLRLFTVMFALWATLSVAALLSRLMYEFRARRAQSAEREPRETDVDALVVRASRHRRGAAKWRRISALTILTRMRDARVYRLLEAALADGDADIASAAVALLGRLKDHQSAAVLWAALCAESYPPSRIATQLDAFPVPIDDLLRSGLDDPRPHVRHWAATLLANYPDAPDLDADLARRARDVDPRVRRAVAQTLAVMAPATAIAPLTELLHDPTPYVRSHAVRALGRIGATELAFDVAALLADRDWIVRLAAKESLVTMGRTVWPAVAAQLDSADAFARNGAAETLQNLGVADDLMRDALSGRASVVQQT